MILLLIIYALLRSMPVYFAAPHWSIALDIVYLLCPFVFLVASIRAYAIYGSASVKSRMFPYFIGGALFWLIGDIVFISSSYLGVEYSYPSVTDIYYLAGYPFFLIALAYAYFQEKVNFSTLDKRIIVGGLIFSMISIYLVIKFVFLQALVGDIAWAEYAVSLGYGFGDVVLLAVSILLGAIALQYSGGKMFRIWACIFLGFVATLFADILYYGFSYVSANIVADAFSDILYAAGYLFLACGMFEFGSMITNVQKKILKN